MTLWLLCMYVRACTGKSVVGMVQAFAGRQRQSGPSTVVSDSRESAVVIQEEGKVVVGSRRDAVL